MKPKANPIDYLSVQPVTDRVKVHFTNTPDGRPYCQKSISEKAISSTNPQEVTCKSCRLMVPIR